MPCSPAAGASCPGLFLAFSTRDLCSDRRLERPIEQQECRVASGLVTCYLKCQTNLHRRSNVNLKNDEACTSDCTLPPNVDPANYRIEHKTVKAQTRINATKVETESRKKTLIPSNMRIQERKQNQRNNKAHTRKHRHVKAELVYEDGTSSLTRKCDDDNRRGLRNHRQEYLFAQATSKCASK